MRIYPLTDSCCTPADSPVMERMPYLILLKQLS